jgi:transcription antitermination factor NusG
MNIFTPTKERIIKLPDKIITKRKAMFPGYIFVETETKAEDFGFFIYRSKYYLQKILKVVRYGRSFDIAMRDEERKFLETIMNKERCVAASGGIIEGDRTVITEEPLVGQEGIS